MYLVFKNHLKNSQNRFYSYKYKVPQENLVKLIKSFAESYDSRLSQKLSKSYYKRLSQKLSSSISTNSKYCCSPYKKEYQMRKKFL